jgi:hypothetical protein
MEGVVVRVVEHVRQLIWSGNTNLKKGIKPEIRVCDVSEGLSGGRGESMAEPRASRRTVTYVITYCGQVVAAVAAQSSYEKKTPRGPTEIDRPRARQSEMGEHPVRKASHMSYIDYTIVCLVSTGVLQSKVAYLV